MIINKRTQKRQFEVLQYLKETTSEERALFRFVHVDIKDGIKRLATTDMHQLHIFLDKKDLFKELKPGLYRLWIIKGEAILTHDKADQDKFIFPVIDNIIPKKYLKGVIVDVRYGRINYNAKAVSDINKKLNGDNYINPIYLNQALKHQPHARCYICEENQPIAIIDDDYFSLIMPMQGKGWL